MLGVFFLFFVFLTQPLLNFGNVRFMGKRVGRCGCSHRVLENQREGTQARSFLGSLGASRRIEADKADEAARRSCL
jgi:hypothetical protein